MPRRNKTYDVFISHDAGGVGTAHEIARVLQANGITAFTEAEVRKGRDRSDTMWEALSESRAVIVLLSRSGISQSMAVEIGGAQAWNKPIFGVVTDPTARLELNGLEGIRLYTMSRIDDVIRAVERSTEDFSEEDRAILCDVYGDVDVSVDQLALEPGRLRQLVTRFNKKAGKIASGEKLLSELLRMRKQGQFRRNAGTQVTRRPTGTG